MTSMNNPIKVLIVDDSAFMRKVLSDFLNSDKQIKVIGFARNGEEAIEKVKLLVPDVVTMDIEMPVMNGIEALSNIMEKYPLPVVMLSSLTSEGAEATMTALELGAIDFLQKPTNIFMVNADNLKKEIVQKIKIAYTAKIVGRSKPSFQKSIYHLNQDTYFNSSKKESVVAIGTSTGGPRALHQIIPRIPTNTPASFLIVQHMPPGFTGSLADRLDQISQIKVKEAENMEKISMGHAYIAPGDYHMKVKINSKKESFIELTKDPPLSGHRPAVDILYQSLAQSHIQNLIAVIMTGMGSDGTNGLVELKAKTDTYVIAQDEQSCVVYGMPKSAIKKGVVDEIVSLEKIIDSIISRVGV